MRTFPVGTPVIFKQSGVAVGDWEIPDGVKGEVVELHPHEFRVRLFPPLPGDPRFAEIERKLERKGKRVEDLDIWVYKVTAADGRVWPLTDTWAKYQSPSRGRHGLPRSQRSPLKPNIAPPQLRVPAPPWNNQRAVEQWIKTTYAVGTPVQFRSPESNFGFAKGYVASMDDARQHLNIQFTDIRDVMGIEVDQEAYDSLNKLDDGLGLGWSWRQLIEAAQPGRWAAHGTLEPLVDNWAKRGGGALMRRHRLPKSQRSWLKPNIRPSQLSVPPPRARAGERTWRHWLETTFAVGTPVKLASDVGFGDYDDPDGFTLPRGTRAVVDGPLRYGAAQYSRYAGVPVRVVDARDASGLPLPEMTGIREVILWQHVDPLVDNWAAAQQPYTGRRYRAPKPNAASKKEIRKLIKRARKQGWTVVTTGGGHLRWSPPDPERPFVITGATPSDYRAFKNIRARLRRAGLKV